MTARKQIESRLTEEDLYLWNEGTHYRLYEKMGAHPADEGTYFAVWAPNADRVSAIGDWNGWNPDRDPLTPRGLSGIWEGVVVGAGPAATYKYHIINGEYRVEKADPFGFHHETPPDTASKVWGLDYHWGDDSWMTGRGDSNSLQAPMSVYEAHLGSWRRGEGARPLTYREMADQLPGYVADLGFTHVEFLPIAEHPFYGSWGYQTTGHFAPTSRYGTPQDFMALVDAFHQAGIGVILDWVPSHFPNDEHGLGYFDGTHLFEHADPRQGFHPDWGTLIFNYGRTEIPSFLISNALFWLDRYHIDGLRVDAVASMLYLDYSREEGEWAPNVHGGRENLEAIAFLRRLNETVYLNYPDVQTIAEESTAWPMVSRPTFLGGLGFGMKWDMGWMHDTLEYMSNDPIHRSYHHHRLTFRAVYAFTENFMLPLSHDEVVHGKGSLVGKMPGDEWQKFANLRLLLAQMWTQPGTKLLFMGGELGQTTEWAHEGQVDWALAERELNGGISRLVGDLNRIYRDYPALHETDCRPEGFEWAVVNDSENSVLAYLRRSDGDETLLVIHNLTPVPRTGYRVGVPGPGKWVEILNTDSEVYGGSGQGNLGAVDTGTLPVPHHGRPESIDLTLPPLATLVLKQFPRDSDNGGEEE
ncbi:MAG TPA: 1,4-alpha-glucan branching protein GlgB [Acidimicrobiia bacterium]|nr:1,4-alpha-glucan branching protein GlgB [Acidimicrobiia bacterium]